MSPRYIVCCGILLASATAVFGQRYYGGYGGWGDNRASTVGESYARGMADLVRSAGEANLRNSEAAKNYEDARSAYFDNRLKYAETYFDMRRINKAQREAERGPPPTTAQVFRWAKAATPNRPPPSELDPLTGQIAWPKILQDEAFAKQRDALDAMFMHRAQFDSAGKSPSVGQIQEQTNELLEVLKSRVRDYSPEQYIAAKKFVVGLAHEARFPAG